MATGRDGTDGSVAPQELTVARGVYTSTGIYDAPQKNHVSRRAGGAGLEEERVRAWSQTAAGRLHWRKDRITEEARPRERDPGLSQTAQHRAATLPATPEPNSNPQVLLP